MTTAPAQPDNGPLNANASTPAILVVEDEQTLRDMLVYNLKREGYRVLSTADGYEAVKLAYAERPDLIILDIMLPGLNGFDVCRSVRKQLITPILMLSAREEEIDKVLGLELGADDYLTKPFSLRELLARVRAMLRRAGTAQPGTDRPAGTAAVHAHADDAPHSSSGNVGVGVSAVSNAAPAPSVTAEQLPVLVAGELVINLGQRTVLLNGAVIDMKPREFDLLAFLALHPLQVFTRDTLLDRVWGYDFVGGTRTVDVHVSWLRSKLEPDPARPRFVQTVHGVGYRFGVPVKRVPQGAGNAVGVPSPYLRPDTDMR
jgi:DNA-binding response OmpR family regulator